jgi:hypothetical protein
MDRLDEIHVSLAAALQRNRPNDPFDAPVTVAEIYQDLVPYRAVRTQLGFDMNADYEHTLLRLLAGEGGLARLEPAEAREELRAELESANPNVGLFRKFAACDVWVARPGGDAPLVEAPVPEAAQAVHKADDGDAWETRSALWMDTSAAEDGVDEEGFELLLDDAIEVEPAGVLESAGIRDPEPPRSADPILPRENHPTQLEEPGLTTSTTPASERGAAATQNSACAFCDSSLPSGRTVKFCPFCGADQSLVPCASCGEALEADWRYCIACGAGAAPA